ncbi:MAG: type II toxin-antitoxin system RelE/ParE family toxin [Deltaproteobacteria bacterium]|nr:type II toxin-antitoxin system RelE/ParE family toxin [Deltaproteobacteria bacterium]
MIKNFGNKLAEDLYDDKISKEVKHFPKDLYKTARRKLLFLHDAASINDLRIPPGNRLELLKGKFKGFYSIQLHDQWRLVFRWQDGDAYNVAVIDYH